MTICKNGFPKDECSCCGHHLYGCDHGDVPTGHDPTSEACGNVLTARPARTIRVYVVEENGDINILDKDHADNGITITRQEARYVFERLREVIGNSR